MVYGFGRGSGGRGGAGLGFRGSSPPWPYVGRGRGGLPRCQYPGVATVPRYAPASPYATQMTRERSKAHDPGHTWAAVEADCLAASIRHGQSSLYASFTLCNSNDS